LWTYGLWSVLITVDVLAFMTRFHFFPKPWPPNPQVKLLDLGRDLPLETHSDPAVDQAISVILEVEPTMFKIQWLSENCIWHTSHSVNNEPAAMQAALRLAQTGRYRAVRVVTRDGSVMFSA
jgi:hypothetical protein